MIVATSNAGRASGAFLLVFAPSPLRTKTSMCESAKDIHIPHPDEYRDLSNDRLLELTTYLKTEMLYRRARENPEQVKEHIGNLVKRGDQAGRTVTLLIDRERSLIESGRLDPCSRGFFLSDNQFHHLVKIIEQACDEYDVDFQPIFEVLNYAEADHKEAIRAVERLERHLRRDDAGDDVASEAAQDAAVPAGQAEVGDAASADGSKAGGKPARNPSDNKWPPDNGLHFRPLEFAYQGKAYRLTGLPHRLFEVIATARKNLHHNEIVEKVWTSQERNPERSTVRGCLARLRAILHSQGLGILAERIKVKDDYWSFLD